MTRYLGYYYLGCQTVLSGIISQEYGDQSPRFEEKYIIFIKDNSPLYKGPTPINPGMIFKSFFFFTK